MPKEVVNVIEITGISLTKKNTDIITTWVPSDFSLKTGTIRVKPYTAAVFIYSEVLFGTTMNRIMLFINNRNTPETESFRQPVKIATYSISNDNSDTSPVTWGIALKNNESIVSTGFASLAPAGLMYLRSMNSSEYVNMMNFLP